MNHIYQENGAVARVEVLSDETDTEGMRRVKLRTIDQLQECPVFGALPDGEFEVSAMKGYAHYIGWTLEEELE